MVFQRASADASATLLEKERANGAPAFRGLQCRFRRGESSVIDDCSKKQADLNISMLSTDDVATDLDSSMDGLSTADVFGQESAADGFLATVPVLTEISTFHIAERQEEMTSEKKVFSCFRSCRWRQRFEAASQPQNLRTTSPLPSFSRRIVISSTQSQRSSSLRSIGSDGSQDERAMETAVEFDLSHKKGEFTTFRDLKRSSKLAAASQRLAESPCVIRH